MGFLDLYLAYINMEMIAEGERKGGAEVLSESFWQCKFIVWMELYI
jgi:hypothetical protein